MAEEQFVFDFMRLFNEKQGEKSIYTIEDNFFRFWYRFVLKNISAVNSTRISAIYDKAIKKYYPDYMGIIFEKMCKDYILKYDENTDLLIKEVGQWWGTDKTTRKEVQIDIVGVPAEGKEYLIGSCKYKNEKIGVDELELLKNYANVFGYGDSYKYYIFSKGGDDLIQSWILQLRAMALCMLYIPRL